MAITELILGLLVGGALVAALMVARQARLREQLRVSEQQLSDQKHILDDAKKQLGDTFDALGAKALRANNQQFLELAKQTFEKVLVEARGDVDKRQQAIDALVKPVKELLERQQGALGELEKKREVAYKGLEEQIKAIAASHEKLNSETAKLVTALRRPEQRGRWGEVQLRNAVELAGMSAHCDFEEQPTVGAAGAVQRPDMVVHLPGGGEIVLDAKVALDAYLSALEDGADRAALAKRHAEQVEQHYRQLSSRRYWEQFERTPKFVVMFMPLESALVAALEVKPNLHTDAMAQHVLIATPTLLVALLRAVAYGWQQEDVARNAREIASVGKQLYERLATFAGHFERVGAALQRGSETYNRAVGSLERMVLPSARKLRELHATTEAEIEAPRKLEVEARAVVAEELREGSGESAAEND